MDALALLKQLDPAELDAAIREKEDQAAQLKALRRALAKTGGKAGGKTKTRRSGPGIKEAVHEWLRKHGPATNKAIGEALGGSSSGISGVLTGNKDLFRKTPEGWRCK